MAYDFYQEDPSKVKFGDNPGHAPKFLFAEPKEFTTIAAAPNTGTTEGETNIIVDDHIFPVGKGFKKASTYRDGVVAEGQTAGEVGFQSKEHMIKGFLVGDYAELKEKVANMLNKAFIVLYQDPECSSTRYQQLGCACDPAVLKEYKYNSGNKTSGGKKGFELTFTAAEIPFDYQGLITQKAL